MVDTNEKDFKKRETKEVETPMEVNPKAETLSGILEEEGKKVEAVEGEAAENLNDEKEALIIHGADSAQTERFDKGREKVEEGIEEAKNIYKKEVTNTQKGSKTVEETKKELREINEEIDRAIRKGLYEEEKKLREKRDQLFSSLVALDKRYGDFGTEAGHIGRGRGPEQKIGSAKAEYAEERLKPVVKEKAPTKTEGKVVEAEAISEKVNEEIKKILRDPTSELSILLKAVNFREEYIEKLKGDLEKAKGNKIDKNDRIKFYEKSIVEHEETLEKHKKRIKEITDEIKEKTGKLSQKNEKR